MTSKSLFTTLSTAVAFASVQISFAQCGPGGTKPYPPGTTVCPSGGGGGGDSSGGGGGSCSAPPCAASLLGDVGKTTVSGRDVRSGKSFPIGENIYGPFEAGFTSQQDFILEDLGCDHGALGHVVGGIDTHMAEQMVAHQCGITLPRIEGNEYISLIDECGGHTNEYHFHERLSCLYDAAVAGHSAAIGEAAGVAGQLLYGMYEDQGTQTLPLLDACGGHFGVTPDSEGVEVYHYHVQPAAPFTFGCYGPAKDEAGNDALVTLETCRSLYDGCSSTPISLTSTEGTVDYALWCPCFDGERSNTGTALLPVFASNDGVTNAPPTEKPSPIPTDAETTAASTAESTRAPTAASTAESTRAPTAASTAESTRAPTAASTAESTRAPTAASTAESLSAPTAASTAESTRAPTAASTAESTRAPTAASTAESTRAPTAASTAESTRAPTAASTKAPDTPRPTRNRPRPRPSRPRPAARGGRPGRPGRSVAIRGREVLLSEESE